MKRVLVIEIDLGEVHEAGWKDVDGVDAALQRYTAQVTGDGVLSDRALYVEGVSVGRARISKRSK